MRSVVVIPTYNERENILRIIEAVLRQPEHFDVLIVDDGSPDGTADIVRGLQGQNERIKLLCRTGRRGLGLSYVDGFKACIAENYDRIFEMDADYSHDPDDLGKLAKSLEEHDMAIGSRYFGGRVSVLNWPISRLALSVFAGCYVRLVTGLKQSDPTSGFRGFRSAVLQSINLDAIKSNGYSFQVETLYRARKCGFRIGEAPIVFTERSVGKSKMSGGIVSEAIMMPWLLRFSRLGLKAQKNSSGRECA